MVHLSLFLRFIFKEEKEKKSIFFIYSFISSLKRIHSRLNNENFISLHFFVIPCTLSLLIVD